VEGRRLESHFGASDRSIAAFVNGELQPGAAPIKPGTKIGDADLLEAVKRLTKDTASESSATDPEREKSKKRRRKGAAEL